MAEKIRIEGLAELEKALLELPKATGSNVLKRAVVNAAKPLAADISARAPVDEGDLRESIKVGKPRLITPGKAAFAAAMRSGASRSEAIEASRTASRVAGGTGKSAVVDVGPTKRGSHGVLQEFGTRHHPPQPFMRPAWDAGRAAAAERIGTELKNEIDKAAQRLARKAARLAAKAKAGV